MIVKETTKSLIDRIWDEGGMVSVKDWQRIRSHKTRKEAKVELDGLIEAGSGRWEPIARLQHHPTRTGSSVFVLDLDGGFELEKGDS